MILSIIQNKFVDFNDNILIESIVFYTLYLTNISPTPNKISINLYYSLLTGLLHER